jgi:hypothetical protein
LPKIGEGFGEWSEAPSYEEGVGVDGDTEGIPSEKRGAGVEPCNISAQKDITFFLLSKRRKALFKKLAF